MLDNLNPDSVRTIVNLACEFHAKEAIFDEPSDDTSGDWALR